MNRNDAYAALADAYLMGDPAEMLAAEYTYLIAVLAPITEWQARTPPSPRHPTLLEMIATLIPDQLPDGAAPSLRDTLHALDLAFAEWQTESMAWQRWQARQLAILSSDILTLIA